MAGPMTDAEKLRARDAFVAKVKEDDAHREQWCKTSLKAHWTGKLGGFASDGANRRWDDFLSGWKAAKAELRKQDEALQTTQKGGGA